MNFIIIKQWYGRLGNNIIQIINGIKIGKDNGYNAIIFPYHAELKTNNIVFDKNTYDKKHDLYDYKNNNYYASAINNDINMNATIFLRYFISYVKEIIIYDFTSNYEYEASIHIRGGDAIHVKEYVPIPLDFLKIMNKTNLILISEDIRMPVAKYIVMNNLAYWKKRSVEEDLKILSNSKSIGLGYGTFSLLALILSIIHGKLKELFLPDYVYYRWKDNWKIDIKDILHPETILKIINMPNYIKVNEYIYNEENIRLMLQYKIP